MESATACEWKIISGSFYKRGSSMLKDFVFILYAYVGLHESHFVAFIQSGWVGMTGTCFSYKLKICISPFAVESEHYIGFMAR